VPRYDFVCQDCGEVFEIRVSMSAYSEDLSPECAKCGSQNTARVFGSVNVVTGGSAGKGPAGGCGSSPFT